MSIEPEIRKIVGKLNPSWFTQLKQEFSEHPLYNKKTQIIDEAVREYAQSYDPQTGELIDEVFDVQIQATLAEYAWKGEDYGIYFEGYEDHFVVKATTLTAKLIEILRPILFEANGIKDKYTFLVSVHECMVEVVTDLKNELNDASYHEVIDYCVQHFIVEIFKEYQSIKKLTIRSFPMKINFTSILLKNNWLFCLLY